MFTIDEFILRLQELRSIAPLGGDTPVVIDTDGAHLHIMEAAAAELQPAIDIGSGEWGVTDKDNDMQVLRVF